MKVYCGHKSVEWKLLERQFSRLRLFSQRKLDGLPSAWIDFKHTVLAKLLRIRDIHQGGIGTLPLKRLIPMTFQSVCFDPRDKIYEMVALAESPGGVVEVDYSKTSFELLSDVILLERAAAGRDKDYLAFVQILQRAMLNLLQAKSPDEMAGLQSVLRCPMRESCPTLGFGATQIGRIGYENQEIGPSVLITSLCCRS